MPWIAIWIAAFCYADALNCVLQGHDDWWLPASCALFAGAFFRPVAQ